MSAGRREYINVWIPSSSGVEIEISLLHRAATLEVAQFLTEKFDSGLESVTVHNVKSAILAVHGGCSNGSLLGSDGSMRQLLTGMFNARPLPSPEIPAWDLIGVLQYLSVKPFELLGKVSL